MASSAPTLQDDFVNSAQLSILEACREINPKIRIVFASTQQLYGKPKYLPVDENILASQSMLIALINGLASGTTYFIERFTGYYARS